jgi:hypothetical protein
MSQRHVVALVTSAVCWASIMGASVAVETEQLEPSSLVYFRNRRDDTTSRSSCADLNWILKPVPADAANDTVCGGSIVNGKCFNGDVSALFFRCLLCIELCAGLV